MNSHEILKDERVLSQRAFQRLLQWLDHGAATDGGTYLEIRRRLVSYFERHNRPQADDLADETLNRVARSLETEPIRISPPARYCYVVAKFVRLEDIRRERARRHVGYDDGDVQLPAASRGFDSEAAAVRERRLRCLDRCLAALSDDQRALMIDYYRGDKDAKIRERRDLAGRLGISMNALGIRACRIREKLERCVGGCCGDEPES